VDHKTVAAVRKGAGGEIPHVEERQGRDGKTYRTRKGGRSRRAEEEDDHDAAAYGGALGISPAGNAERVDVLPDAIKLAMFKAGLSASSTVVVEAPSSESGMEPHEVQAWNAFNDFLIARCGWSPEAAGQHIEWLLGGFRTPDEWLGEEGRKYRARYGWRDPSAQFVEGWRRRLAEAAP
jgi:hypothetical protein